MVYRQMEILSEEMIMSENKFKTMRHIETVRNYLGEMVRALLFRAERHDQTKLQSPEAEIFEEYTPKLKGSTYGSEEYKAFLKEMKVALDSHYLHNRHHPEYFTIGHEYNAAPISSVMERMNLIDLIEMVCDWKAATLRHADGNIYRSLEINQERFGYSDELKSILKNTVDMIHSADVKHHAEES